MKPKAMCDRVLRSQHGGSGCTRASRQHSRSAEQAAAGEEITITVHGRPVAALVALNRPTRRPFNKAELISMLQTSQADAGLSGDLERLAGDTTDDLGPIE
jgi:antitoxin (DNA-binding transcriptional repressor) of toxin-antitoxin stability system